MRFGRVQTKVPSLPIIGTWVGPQAKTGARYERGGLIVERFAIHSVRASFEPRASLIVRAPLAPGSLEDGRPGPSEYTTF